MVIAGLSFLVSVYADNLSVACAFRFGKCTHMTCTPLCSILHTGGLCLTLKIFPCECRCICYTKKFSGYITEKNIAYMEWEFLDINKTNIDLKDTHAEADGSDIPRDELNDIVPIVPSPAGGVPSGLTSERAPLAGTDFPQEEKNIREIDVSQVTNTEEISLWILILILAVIVSIIFCSFFKYCIFQPAETRSRTFGRNTKQFLPSLVIFSL